MQIKLFDLRRQYHRYRGEIDEAVRRVLDSGMYVLGDEVADFENEFASYCEAKHCIAVGNGTDALYFSLKALGVKPGDEVITTPHTFISTALCISRIGARPVFADIDFETRNIDPREVKKKITKKTSAIIPVHLYGVAADIAALSDIAREYGVKLVEDASQAHGARYQGRRVGSLGHSAAFSLGATKNLGCYGDGGAVVTNDDDVAHAVRQLRRYGARERDDYTVFGTNSRLDALQAAILRVKLRHLDDWIEERRERAVRYTELLQGVPVTAPTAQELRGSVFYVYTIRTDRRDALARYLAAQGLETRVHYPVPLHLQTVYKDLGYSAGDFPHAERMAGETLSLPLFAELRDEEIRTITGHIRTFFQTI